MHKPEPVEAAMLCVRCGKHDNAHVKVGDDPHATLYCEGGNGETFEETSPPCRRCQECGYLTSLPFDRKVMSSCLDGGEHKFKEFPNGESSEDLAHAAELIKRVK